VDAVKAAKSIDFAKVQAAIHGGKFKTVVGDLSYDAKGDVKGRTFVVYKWHDGKYAPV
jgi:branched-chain amino acid transport system substrate-binding protein